MDQTNLNFSNIELSEKIQRGISDMGYEEATSIQAQTIPLILQGCDVIGRSQTGSGKTAAFGLPALEMIDSSMNPRTIQILILCPTRELALQGCEELNKFSKYKEEINIVPIFGGESYDRQISALRKGCQIVIGTPGRIMDHMRRGNLSFKDIKMVVLDEADEMLDMGFVEDIETILKETPQARQTVLFSATMSPAVLKITKRFQKNPKLVEIECKQMTVETIEQSYYKITKINKMEALNLLLDLYAPEAAIIFCNTKRTVDSLTEELTTRGFAAQALHGDLRQASRTQVMKRFKEGKFSILVATDVAARGIDVNNIEIVFNYDLPIEYEYYVHRIGRTGRAGKSGRAFTLVQGRAQMELLRKIAHYTKCEIPQVELPSATEIAEKKSIEFSAKVLEFIKDNDCSVYVPIIEKMIEDGHTAIDVAASIFGMSIKKNSSEDFKYEEPDYVEPTQSDSRSSNRHSRSDSGKSRDSYGKKSYGDSSSRNSSDRGSYSYDRGSDRKKSYGSDDHKRRRDDDDSRTKTHKQSSYATEGMVGIKLSVGKDDGILPNHILGAVAGETGLPGKMFGHIDIRRSCSIIDVPQDVSNMVVSKLNNTRIKGIKITADLDESK